MPKGENSPWYVAVITHGKLPSLCYARVHCVLFFRCNRSYNIRKCPSLYSPILTTTDPIVFYIGCAKIHVKGYRVLTTRNLFPIVIVYIHDVTHFLAKYFRIFAKRTYRFAYL